MTVIQRTAKQQAALDRLLERYVTALEEKIWKQKLTPAQRQAATRMAERYWDLREALAQTKSYAPLSCDYKIDRVIFNADDLDLETFAGMERATKPRRLWRQDYASVLTVRRLGSIKKMFIYYHPTAGWLAPYRIVIIPKDSTGLALQDLKSVWSLLRNPRLSAVEAAADFPADTIIDLEYVRRFGLYGKTQVMWGKKHHAGKTGNPFHEKFGSRNSKIVRTYFKWEIFCFRIELQLHLPFLRKKGITVPEDLWRLADLLIPHHVAFKRLNDDKVVRSLSKRSLSPDVQQEILAKAKSKARSRLWSALQTLHQPPAKLQNVQRNLDDIVAVNEVLRVAARDWAERWRRKQ